MVGHWDVLTAGSGAEGIARAASEQPDAILLDVMMPDLDGFATLERLRSNPATQDIPVVFVTAKVQNWDKSFLESVDVSGVIAKPFDPLQLPTLVKGRLGWTD